MFKKIIEFIHSFKVKPVTTSEAPYKLEPPETTTNDVPLTVEAPKANVETVETSTIQFPKGPSSEIEDSVIAKKPAAKRKPKAVAATSKGKPSEENKSVPAMKVVKTRTTRKSKKPDIE